MNTNTHTNGSSHTSRSLDEIMKDDVRPEAHTLASLLRIAKAEEKHVRKVRKETEKKEKLLARIEKARTEGFQARDTDMAMDRIIADKVGSRYV